MAEGTRFVGDACGHAIASWSDGNPDYLDPDRGKVYAYHPHHDDLVPCIGNDAPHLCLTRDPEFPCSS